MADASGRHHRDAGHLKEAFLKLIEPGSSLRERVFRDIARRDDVDARLNPAGGAERRYAPMEANRDPTHRQRDRGSHVERASLRRKRPAIAPATRSVKICSIESASPSPNRHR